jgi:alpha-glucoside transport system permease protein
MSDILQQILGAVTAILLALAGLVIYFWGTNWLLDRFLSSNTATGDEITRRDNIRSQIRPWLFLFPALLFLTVYLVYPVIETFRLSFFDKNGVFIGFGNYVWAFGDNGFRQ